eukprot:SAG31_NODE_16366_length_712_cov_0.603589_1_plen_71_part_01
MGHGMLGVVGAGALNGIEQALWDIKVRCCTVFSLPSLAADATKVLLLLLLLLLQGKALGVPVWQLLGGESG